MGDYFQPGQYVEAFGLASATGQLLNGRRGIVFRHNKATDRVEVHFENEKEARSLHCERLRKVQSENVRNEFPQVLEVAAAMPAQLVIDLEAVSTSAVKSNVAEVKPSALDGNAAPAPTVKAKTLEDLNVEDNIEAFGLKGFQAQYNGKTGVIMQICSKGWDKRGIFVVKFSDLIIDSNGELAEKGQVLNLERANCRLPGTGPPGEKHEQPSEPSEKQSGFSSEKPSGFSKARRSRSRTRSRSRRKKSRSKSRSRRRRKKSRSRRRR